jgi:hypothetical protein
VQSTPPPATPPGIPEFEGETVELTAAKVTSASALEIDDQAWRMDNYVELVVTCRVVGVDHKVNDKTGKLTRVHTLKVVEPPVVLKSYDPRTI